LGPYFDRVVVVLLPLMLVLMLVLILDLILFRLDYSHRVYKVYSLILCVAYYLACRWT
jgi:hypothetical protein